MYTGHMAEAMREPTYLLLTALAAGRQHGYGLVQEVERLSAGRVQLRAGTLYGALERMTAEGLVAVDGEEVVAGRFRRYYALTDDGVGVLAVETAQRQTTTRTAARRLRALGVSA
jgi:DNA-binding PadR family transcriptional regulator